MTTELAVYFANLLAHERAPDWGGGSCPNEPALDSAYLRSLGMEDEIADWRITAESVKVS